VVVNELCKRFEFYLTRIRCRWQTWKINPPTHWRRLLWVGIVVLGVGIFPWIPSQDPLFIMFNIPPGEARTSSYPYDSIESLVNDDETIIFQISGRSVGNGFFDYLASHISSVDGVRDVLGIEVVYSPGYCAHDYTRRFSFAYHEQNYIIENCDYSGYEGIVEDSAALMDQRPEHLLGHMDAISVKFCPYDVAESSVHSVDELNQVLDTIRDNWQNHNINEGDNLNLVYWTLVPVLHSQWHDPNDDTFPTSYHQPVNEHIKEDLADPVSGIVSFDVWSRLVEGSPHAGFMNPIYAVSATDNHLNEAGNDVLMLGFLYLLEEWFGSPSFFFEDVNQDGRIDALDLQLVVNVAIRAELDPILVARADINSDGLVDQADIQGMIERLLR
jgi:hypothetical protein